ncbi:Phosphotransferase enzyme family protein [Kytococcus aerolatus]|uniref:Phosphotransferase enzyme family protein n=1 Tax=Kytococcus aerolatus TaxID=592308 RepID=A0A212T2I7_9MICO|nr:aminoglycoside phosphotransferase family protein [Kytococcus aerolatus]SNC60235.1 Phosphotransferase enzyme family protein [Kytococcus aerolatus]
MVLGLNALTEDQRRFVEGHLGAGKVVTDHSWGQTDTVVLEVASDRGRVIVKAAGPSNGHIAREIRVHRAWTAPWVASGRAARLLAADEELRVLITEYLPGELVEGTPAQEDPFTYEQAGRLIAAFHAQHSTVDPSWNDSLRGRVERFLAMPHRIDATIAERVRDELAGWPTGGATVVPTHGDWQPRNWLDDHLVLRIIDFGRADLRPPEEDLVRLGRQDFLRRPELEAAFLAGYGRDPREPGAWRRMNVAEAVGTAVWALHVGDEEFEAVGHAHLARLYPR